MARQVLGPQKTAKLAAQTGLPIHHVLVRGNTGHRRDLCLDNGEIVSLWPDGSTEPADLRWKVREDAAR